MYVIFLVLSELFDKVRYLEFPVWVYSWDIYLFDVIAELFEDGKFELGYYYFSRVQFIIC